MSRAVDFVKAIICRVRGHKWAEFKEYNYERQGNGIPFERSTFCLRCWKKRP